MLIETGALHDLAQLTVPSCATSRGERWGGVPGPGSRRRRPTHEEQVWHELHQLRLRDLRRPILPGRPNPGAEAHPDPATETQDDANPPHL